MTSGGGDVQALEFTSLGYELAGYLSSLKSRYQTQVPGIEPAQFLATVQSTRVVTEDNLELDGKAVDAINVPDLKLIRVSRGRWHDSVGDQEFRVGLVFHEYLGIMRMNDQRYDVTKDFLQLLARYGFESAKQISCHSFQRRPYSPDITDDGKLDLTISNRSLFNGMVAFQLADQNVDATAIMDRFTREVPPSVYEMYQFEDPTQRFHFTITVKIPNGTESYDSTAVVSDIISGERTFLSFELKCTVDP
jgi:hypothetical protein